MNWEKSGKHITWKLDRDSKLVEYSMPSFCVERKHSLEKGGGGKKKKSLCLTTPVKCHVDFTCCSDPGAVWRRCEPSMAAVPVHSIWNHVPHHANYQHLPVLCNDMFLCKDWSHRERAQHYRGLRPLQELAWFPVWFEVNNRCIDIFISSFTFLRNTHNMWLHCDSFQYNSLTLYSSSFCF